MKVSELLAKYDSDKVPRGEERGHSYGSFYDELFSHNPTDILEVGVHFGRSIRAWCEAFPNAKVDGIDNDPIFQGDKPTNFNYIIDDVKNVKLDREYDIIIDDGSHLIKDQMWVAHYFPPFLKKGGKLVIEDIQVEEYLSQIASVVPIGFVFETVDLRKVQGWTDDLLVVIYWGK